MLNQLREARTRLNRTLVLLRGIDLNTAVYRLALDEATTATQRALDFVEELIAEEEENDGPEHEVGG